VKLKLISGEALSGMYMEGHDNYIVVDGKQIKGDHILRMSVPRQSKVFDGQRLHQRRKRLRDHLPVAFEPFTCNYPGCDERRPTVEKMAEHHKSHIRLNDVKTQGVITVPAGSWLAETLLGSTEQTIVASLGKGRSQVTTEVRGPYPKNPSYKQREEMARLFREGKTPEEVSTIVGRKVVTVLKYKHWGPEAQEVVRKERSRTRASKVRIIVPATREQVTGAARGMMPAMPPVATTALRDRLLIEVAKLAARSQVLLDEAAALDKRARELADIANGKTDIGELLVRLLAKEYGLAESR